MPSRLSRWQLVAISITAIAALAGLFVAARLITKNVTAAPPPATGAPTPTGTAAADTPPAHICGRVSTVDSHGSPVDQVWLDLVTPVHDAACRHDYEALQRLMDAQFNGSSPDIVIAQWHRDDPEAQFLDILAQIMETPAILNQGGVTFCNRADDASVFARGTHDHPPSWTYFDISPTSRAMSFCERQ